MIFLIGIFTLLASVSSTSLTKRLNVDLIRELFTFGKDVQAKLSQTCKDFDELSRENSALYCVQKGMPYFSELPYHPDWEMIMDFPAQNDLNSKARHFLITIQWLTRVPKKALMHKQAETAVVKEIASSGQPLLDALVKVTVDVPFFRATLSELVRILLENNEIEVSLTIHRLYKRNHSESLLLFKKDLDIPGVIETLRANPKLFLVFLSKLEDILDFIIFKTDMNLGELEAFLPELYGKYGVDALLHIRDFFFLVNNYEFTVKLDSFKLIYNYFSTRHYPSNLLRNFESDLRMRQSLPHSDSARAMERLLHALQRQDRKMFLESLNDYSFGLLHDFVPTNAQIAWMESMINEPKFRKYALVIPRMRSCFRSLELERNHESGSVTNYLQAADPINFEDASAFFLKHPEPNYIRIYLTRVSALKAQKFAIKLLKRLPKENSFEILSVISSITGVKALYRRLRPKTITATKQLLKVFMENPESYKILKRNSFKIRVKVYDKAAIELVLRSKTLSRLFLEGGIATSECIILREFSFHDFERAIKIFHLDYLLHLEWELDRLPLTKFSDVMSVALLAKIWRKHNPDRYEQVKADPSAQDRIENKLVYSRESIKEYVDFFTRETWETMRVFLSVNQKVMEAVRQFVLFGSAHENQAFQDDESEYDADSDNYVEFSDDDSSEEDV